MKISFVWILLVAAILCIAFPATNSLYLPLPPINRCGVNEHYTSCGTSCPLRCGQPPPMICNAMCKIGCQCLPGFYLNANNKCVLPIQC